MPYTDPNYQGIVFPDRAEALQEEAFSHYRVFLDHWARLAGQLRLRYEDLVQRNATHCVLILGSQGSGKTLFATKLVGDQRLCRSAGGDSAKLSSRNNLWSLMTGSSQMKPALVERATANTSILHIEDNENWVAEAIEHKKRNEGRYSIVIADNAERDYFTQSLLGLSRVDYLKIGRTADTQRVAAQKFVALCRRELRGLLIVAFTNDEKFASSFRTEVDAQHEGLLILEKLDLPDPLSKETVVRVNINRLNPVSYWHCLDRAGPVEKSGVYETFHSATTFPAAFKAVDNALKNAPARGGRPAKRNQLTFVVMHEGGSNNVFSHSTFPMPADEIIVDWKWCKISRFARWASIFSSDYQVDSRESQLVASEWDLRIVTCGEPFVAALLDSSVQWKCKQFLDACFVHHGPGTSGDKKGDHQAALKTHIDALDSFVGARLPDFWSKGNVRSHDYERSLRAIYLGKYNVSDGGALSYRPDLVVGRFHPCSIVAAGSADRDDLNEVIRREAHFVEFTAIKDYAHDKLIKYIVSKLSNYIEITQEQ